MLRICLECDPYPLKGQGDLMAAWFFFTGEENVYTKNLAKIFSTEEAALASELRLTPESAEQIAKRTGRDPGKTAELLMEMMQKILIMLLGV